MKEASLTFVYTKVEWAELRKQQKKKQAKKTNNEGEIRATINCDEVTKVSSGRHSLGSDDLLITLFFIYYYLYYYLSLLLILKRLGLAKVTGRDK